MASESGSAAKHVISRLNDLILSPVTLILATNFLSYQHEILSRGQLLIQYLSVALRGQIKK